jgi:hypothetical protein
MGIAQWFSGAGINPGAMFFCGSVRWHPVIGRLLGVEKHIAKRTKPMSFKSFLLAGVAAGIFATPVLAVSQDTLDGIIADLSSQGYARIEIVNGPNSVKVEAYGPNGKLERYYNADGTVAREELKTSDGLNSYGDDDNGLDDDGRDDDRDDDHDDRDDDLDDDDDDDRDDDRDDDDHDDDHDDKDGDDD